MFQDEGFLRYFIEDKLPGLNMVSIRSSGWEFITKAIETLDTELGMDYVLTPMPLLWRIVREAYGSSHAMKFMTGRLLRVSPYTGRTTDLGECAVVCASRIRSRRN
jgi:hypothetical protein